MVVETYGTWSPEATDVLNQVAEQYAIHQGVKPTTARQWLYQALSTQLQLYNAAMLVTRNASTPAHELALPEVEEFGAYGEIDVESLPGDS